MRLTVLIAVLALCTLPTSATALAQEPPPRSSGGASFYDVPTTLVSNPGEIVKSEPMALPVTVPGESGPLPAEATRLMYGSTGRHGENISVTGAYMRPTTPWHGPGVRPVVVVAPGTQGQGDQCAPSNTLGQIAQYNGGLDAALQYESLVSIYPLLLRGIAVVLTDYQGFGTPGAHTYLSRAATGHAVLDAARAARSFPGNGLDAAAPVGLWGYSQGGGAVAAAAELASTYAPELPIVGTYAGAPVVDAEANLRHFDGSSLTGAIGYYLNGAIDEDPQLRSLIEREFTPAGTQMLADVARQCVAETVITHGLRDSRGWTRSGKPVTDVLMSDPQWAAHMQADRVGSLRPNAPVLVASTPGDELVPMHTARNLAADWCAQGAHVTYREQPLISDPIRLGLGHVLKSPFNLPDALAWMDDRFAGLPTPTTC